MCNSNPLAPPIKRLLTWSRYWLEMFSGEYVRGEKLAAVMAQFADAGHIEGVAYHPDRYVDADDEMRARCWVLFEEIDSNHDHHISYCGVIGGRGGTRRSMAATCP